MAIFKFLDLNGLSTLLDQLSAKFVKKSDVESELSPTSTNPIQNKTVNTELNKKLSTNGGTMSGNINMGSNYISNVDSISFTPDDEENSISIFSREEYQGYVLNIRQGIDELPIELNGIKAPENDDSAVPKSYVDDAIMDIDPNGKYLKLSGGILSGNLSLGSHDITNAGSISMKPYAGRTISFEGSAINTGGDVGTYGMLDFKDEKAQDVWLGGIRNPINNNQAATKKYVDEAVANASNIVELTKAEYDEMLSSDTIDENTYYAITDDELNTDDFTPDIIYQNNRLYIKAI